MSVSRMSVWVEWNLCISELLRSDSICVWLHRFPDFWSLSLIIWDFLLQQLYIYSRINLDIKILLEIMQSDFHICFNSSLSIWLASLSWTFYGTLMVITFHNTTAGVQTESKRKKSPPEAHHVTRNRTVAWGSHSQTEKPLLPLWIPSALGFC